MTVWVNGKPHQIADGLTIAKLVEELGLGQGDGIAVAVDEEVVSRSEWRREVKDGNRVEVVRAVQGG